MKMTDDEEFKGKVSRLASEIDVAFKQMDDPLVEIARKYGPEVLAGALTNYLCCVLAGSPSDRRDLLVALTCEKIDRQVRHLAAEVGRIQANLHHGSEKMQ